MQVLYKHGFFFLSLLYLGRINEKSLAFIQFSSCACFCVLCPRESKVRPAGNDGIFVGVFVITTAVKTTYINKIFYYEKEKCVIFVQHQDVVWSKS